MLLIVYFLFIVKYFATIMSTDLSLIFLLCFFTPIFQCQCFLTCHTYMLVLFHGGSGICDFLNFICIIYVWFLFTFFCHLVAHQHLTWAHYLLPWPFQNSLSYCELQIFMSISFFIIKSAFSTTLFSLSFSTSSFVLHSKQFCHNNFTKAQCALSG